MSKQKLKLIPLGGLGERTLLPHQQGQAARAYLDQGELGGDEEAVEDDQTDGEQYPGDVDAPAAAHVPCASLRQVALITQLWDRCVIACGSWTG